jgi:hypothetical protein
MVRWLQIPGLQVRDARLSLGVGRINIRGEKTKEEEEAGTVLRRIVTMTPISAVALLEHLVEKSARSGSYRTRVPVAT